MSKCPMCGTPAAFEIRLPDGSSISAASLVEANRLLRTHQRQCPNDDLSITIMPRSVDDAYAVLCREALAPFAELGRPFNPGVAAFHDLEPDTVLFVNSGIGITVGHIRAIHAALAKNPNPSGQLIPEPSVDQTAEDSGPVGLGPIDVEIELGPDGEWQRKTDTPLTGRCPCCGGKPHPAAQVRLNDDGTLDEVCGEGGNLEQCHGGLWWLQIGDVAVWLTSKRSITATYERREMKRVEQLTVGMKEKP